MLVIRADLVEAIVAHARGLGLYTNLITAGVLLDEGRIASLAAAGLDHVQLSLQAAEPVTADRVGGYRGGHAKKLEVARLARCARSPDLGEEYVDTVLQINRLLNRATPNRRLSNYLSSLEQQTARYSRLGLSTPERRRQSVQRWQKLVKAIRAGDGEQAERIARERVLESRDAALKLLSARQDQPSRIATT